MTVLRKDASVVPVWGAKYAVVSGLDPLGMQNASEATFAALMPGVTNLTNHIRYYGFYCWLLEHYSKHIKHTDQLEQNRFIRRAELIMALLMSDQAPDVQQVPGSLFATRTVRDHEGDVFDLRVLADKDSTTDTYWKYSSGAYGQYYTGAMREIGLNLLNDEGNFICTRPEHPAAVNGVRLAEAFHMNIPNAIAARFLNCIEQGRITRADLKALYPHFNLVPIPAATDEWSAYTELLMDDDRPMLADRTEVEPSHHRRSTLRHVLTHLARHKGNEVPGPRTFTEAVHQELGTLHEANDATLMGWYYYQANECWQYGSGSCLFGMLGWLQEQGGILPYQGFVDRLVQVTLAEYKRRWKIGKDMSIADVQRKLPALYDLMPLVEERVTPAEDLALGSAVLLALHTHDHPQQDALALCMRGLNAERDGNVLRGLAFIEQHRHLELQSFLRAFLQEWVLSRHTQVAFRKLAGSGTFTAKFMVEEGYIRLIDVFPPQFTSPRLGALLNLLRDLELVTTDNTLTARGRIYLERLSA